MRILQILWFLTSNDNFFKGIDDDVVIWKELMIK